MLQRCFLIAMVWGLSAHSANLHKQIDECQVTKDEDCLKGILHQIVRAQEQPQARAPRSAGLEHWCVCEKDPIYSSLQTIYLIRKTPDGKESKQRLNEESHLPGECTQAMLANKDCK